MTLSLMASVARNGTIGRDNAPFGMCLTTCRSSSADGGLAGGDGAQDVGSVPPSFRPLPGRRNVVVTLQAGWQAAGAEVAHSLDDALALVAEAPKVFVIGGAQLYAQVLERADELVLTEIDREIEGDAFFPRWERDAFDEVSSEAHVSADGVGYRFVTYRRKG